MSVRAAPLVVVGGGITGLAAAHQVLTLLGPGAASLLEATPRLGGKIVSAAVGSFLIEGGPDGFLAAKPAGTALCRELGLAHRLQGTRPEYRRTYVKRDGRLHPLPEGWSGLLPTRMGPLLSTRVLTVRGRLRAGLELLVPRRRQDDDESVAGFVTRRFGVEAYRWLVEPLICGIHAADGEALSLAATFPQLRTMERARGGVLRSMLLQRPARGGAPGLVAPAGGMAEIVTAVAARLGAAEVRLDAPVRRLTRRHGGYTLELADGTSIGARGVIVATPADAAAALLADLDADLAHLLAGVPFVSTATISVAFPASAVPAPLDGYGYVSPRAEGSPLVACTWASNKFAGRAAPGHALLRFFVGRAGMDEIVQRPDGELREIVRRELADTLGIRTAPTLWRFYRWPRAIPQYVMGHLDRVARIEARLAAHPGVFLAGGSYRGVGIPDCIASGQAAARAAAAYVRA